MVVHLVETYYSITDMRVLFWWSIWWGYVVGVENDGDKFGRSVSKTASVRCGRNLEYTAG